MLDLVHARASEDIAAIRELFLEYAASLGFSLCFQNFDKEVADLPGTYAEPAGRLLLARLDGKVAGCIALRQLDKLICDMKRLYVRPEARGHGIGWALALTLLDEASEIGYSSMRLDTVPGKMDSAIAMYRALGFYDIPAYCVNPIPGALYLERRLPVSMQFACGTAVDAAVQRLVKLKQKP